MTRAGAIAIPTATEGIDMENGTAAPRRNHWRGVAQEARVADRPYLMALYADPCAYCGESGGYVDHIDAIARGGRHHWTNYTATCGRCNSRKRTTSLLGFLGWLQADHGEMARLKALVEAFLAQQRAWRAVGA